MFSHFKYRFKRSSSTNGMSNQSCCELLFVVCALNCLPDTLLLPLPFKIALKLSTPRNKVSWSFFPSLAMCDLFFHRNFICFHSLTLCFSRHYRREMYFYIFCSFYLGCRGFRARTPPSGTETVEQSLGYCKKSFRLFNIQSDGWWHDCSEI